MGRSGDFKGSYLHLKIVCCLSLNVFEHLTADMNLITEKFAKAENKNERRVKFSSYILAVISVFFITFIVLLGHKWNSSRIIKSVNISGNVFLSVGEIRNIIDTMIINKPQEKISLSRIQQKLNSYPFIMNSTAMFSDLETITVEITENLPKLILERDSINYFVMEDLCIYPFREFTKKLNIPLVKNLTLQTAMDSLILRDVISFVEDANKDNQLKNSIVKIIVYNDIREFQIYLENTNFSIKTKIKNNLTKELKDALVFFGTEYYQKSNGMINYIDARWNDKLYVMEKY